MLPLNELPPGIREEIEHLASAPTPPPKWIEFGINANGRALASMVSRAWIEWHLRNGNDRHGQPRGRSIPKALREAIIARDGLVCALCGEPTKEADVHIDHRTPFSLGGTHDPENLQVAHAACNLAKGNRA